MQMLDLETLQHVDNQCGWSGSNSYYFSYVYTTSEEVLQNKDINLVFIDPYTGKRNSYDESLEWMVSSTDVDLDFKRKNVTAETVTYEVVCTVSDRFDFHTSSNSGFKNLISGIGALLFREFDWESTVTFELTVPYSCTHNSNSYRLTYDAANRVFTSDNSDGYSLIGTEWLSYQEYAGNTTPYYYKLDKTVRLYHDKPWVMEYKVRNSGNFVLSALSSCTISQPLLMNYGSFNLFFQHKKIVDSKTIYDCYGTKYRDI